MFFLKIRAANIRINNLNRKYLAHAKSSKSQYLCRMILRIHLPYHPHKHPFLIKNERLSQRPHRHLTIHFLLAPRTQRLQNRRIRIRQQIKRQTILLPEFPVRLRRILAHSHHTISLSQKPLKIIPYIASLSRTPWRIILRITINHRLPSNQIL